MRRILIGMAVLTAALFAALTVISVGWLQTGEHVIFDSRISGYDVAETRDYLATLTAAQTALYLGLFRVLDTFFPVLLAMTLTGAIWVCSAGLSQPQRALVVLSPAVYLILDLAENLWVAHLLRTGPQVSEGAILQASAYTIGKWIALSLAVLLLVWAWRIAPKRGLAA